MCAKKFSFSVDKQDIYSFLMDDVSSTARIIFMFDRKKRTVSFRSFDNLGQDTGIYIGLKNIVNEFEVESTSESAIVTKLIPTGSNNLGIEFVNFGEDCIYDMDYFVNTLNEYDDYQFVTESFHNEYTAWQKKREQNRNSYIDLTKEYNANIAKISELTNRVPNDGCEIDYTTYKPDELKISHKAYTNALLTLISLYKDDYPDIYNSVDIPLDEEHLKTTVYWFDYYAYKYKILPSVEESMKIWYKTENGKLLVDENGEFILCEVGGNPEYNTDTSIIKPVNSYLYEFDLYGLDELNSKKKAWLECASLLYKDAFIKEGTKETPVQYRSPDNDGWEELTSEQKKQFSNPQNFIDTLNSYLDYMSIEERDNALTGTNCIGVIRQCDNAIAERANEIDILTQKNNDVNEQRKAISNDVSVEQNFNSENLKIFYLLTSESNYENANILTTNLDDVVTTIDKQEELYQDAIEQLFTLSHPQYSFRVGIDDLFHIEEFEPLREFFEIGNFVRLQTDMYKDIFVKLRLISIERNPFSSSSDVTVEFSTMTKSLSGLSDFSSLFDNSISSGGTSSTSSSSSSGGSFGTNNAEIQIANTMLNALLSMEAFGTKVSDVLLDTIKANKGNFNVLFANSAAFDALEVGNIKINGACLMGLIQSANYNPDGIGSILNLNDGSFSFGGGALSYSPIFGLNISDKAGNTNISGGCITTGLLKSGNWNGTEKDPLSNTLGTILQMDDGTFNFGGGKCKWDGKELTIDGKGNFEGNTKGKFEGAVKGTSGSFSETVSFEKTVSFGEKHSIKDNGAQYTGNAATATKAEKSDKLSSARTISLSGDVTGSVSFDGSNNVTIGVTVTDKPLKSITTFWGDGWDEAYVVHSFDTSEYDMGSSSQIGSRFLIYLTGRRETSSNTGTDDAFGLYLLTKKIFGTTSSKIFAPQILTLGLKRPSTTDESGNSIPVDRWKIIINTDDPVVDFRCNKGSGISGKIWMLD